MTKLVERELYLWQGIVIFMVTFLLLYGVGHFYTDKLVSLYYNFSMRNTDVSPVSNQDRLMMALENKVEENPNNPNDYLQLGWIYHQKGYYKEAIRAYMNVLYIQGEHVGAYYNLGLVYMDMKDYEKAEDNFKRILNKYPEHELAGVALIKLYYQTANYLKGEEWISILKPHLYASADYHYYQGLVYAKQHLNIEASAALRKALSLDPNFKEAREALNIVEIQN